MFRVTNTSKAPHVVYDKRIKAVTIAPGATKEIDLDDAVANRIKNANNHALKVEGVGLPARRTTVQEPAAKSGKSDNGKKPADEKAEKDKPAETIDEKKGAADQGAQPGGQQQAGGAEEADKGKLNVSPHELADLGEKNEISHWIFVKNAKLHLGENCPTKKADILDALRKLPKG